MTKFLRTCAVLAAALPILSSAQAATLVFEELSTSSNAVQTGASATVEMTFTDLAPGQVKLTVDIENTTDQTSFGAGATEAQLTGFGFTLLEDVSILSGSFSGGAFLDTEILGASFQPFPDLDFAAADNSNFNGGNAQGALPEGQSDSFMVTLLTTLSAIDLDAAFTAAFNDPDDDVIAGLRFQSVNAGAGSDKLVFVGDDDDGGDGNDGNDGTSPVPLPAGALLLLSGLGVLALRRKI